MSSSSNPVDGPSAGEPTDAQDHDVAQLTDEQMVAKLYELAERLRAQLDACLIAALGQPSTEPIVRGARSWSPAYEAIHALRAKLDKFLADDLEAHRENESAARRRARQLEAENVDAMIRAARAEATARELEARLAQLEFEIPRSWRKDKGLEPPRQESDVVDTPGRSPQVATGPAAEGAVMGPPLRCRVGFHRWSTWGPGRYVQVVWMSDPDPSWRSPGSTEEGGVAFLVGQDAVCLRCQKGRSRRSAKGMPGDAVQLPGAPGEDPFSRWIFRPLVVAQKVGAVDVDVADWLTRRGLTRLPDVTHPACQSWPQQGPLPLLCRCGLHVGEDVCRRCHRIP